MTLGGLRLLRREAMSLQISVLRLLHAEGMAVQICGCLSVCCVAKLCRYTGCRERWCVSANQWVVAWPTVTSAPLMGLRVAEAGAFLSVKMLGSSAKTTPSCATSSVEFASVVPS